jgi:DNA-binding NarL/FixJ family response regulator
MPPELRLLIADDHPLMRRGLRDAIAEDRQLTVVGEAANGTAALAILDIDMPGLDGFGIVRVLLERKIATDIIFLTVHRDQRLFDEALRLGVKGYVLKDSAASDVLSAIRAVAAGEHYTSPALTSHLVRRRRGEGALATAADLHSLTPTERRVLALLAEYKTSREIGDALHISCRTVQTHRANICSRLDLQGSHALMKFALDHKSEL